jgi:hypothetical protein
MLRLLGRVRSAYLGRFPQVRGEWNVGALARLASVAIGLATFPMVRAERRVAPGRLHPALSSMLVIADALCEALRPTLADPRSTPQWMSDPKGVARQIVEHLEHRHTRVAGMAGGSVWLPMVEDFVAVLVDGRLGARDVPLDAALEEALADLEPAIDYALLGLKVQAAMSSLQPTMMRRYATLARLAADWSARADSPAQPIAEMLRQALEARRRALPEAQDPRCPLGERACADMYAHCAAGLYELSAGSLPEQVAAHRDLRDAELVRRLMALAQARFGSADTDFSIAVADYLLEEQAVLRVAAATQSRINARLRRPECECPPGADPIGVPERPAAGAARHASALVLDLEVLLGLRIDVDASTLSIDTQAPIALH